MTISMMTNAAAVPGAAQVRAARVAQPIAAQPIAAKRQRIGSIDALRGLVMLLMLVDHTREYFYSHAPVSDPMSLATTPPALFFTRFAAHLCAPIFVLLTGLAAWLYAEGRDPERRSAAASSFLLKRGVVLTMLTRPPGSMSPNTAPAGPLSSSIRSVVAGSRGGARPRLARNPSTYYSAPPSGVPRKPRIAKLSRNPPRLF